jgi:8-oxo-dGTP diphosphatase
MPTIEADVSGCAQAGLNRRPAASLPIILVAAVALIDSDGRILVCRRPATKAWAGWWEFPGGKVEPGESPESAVVRELKEELAIDIVDSCLAPFTFASHAYDDFHLLMPLYLCRIWKGQPMAREGQALRWLRPRDLAALDKLMPADRPLVAMLRDYL